jgi:hypothetical protein
LMQALFLTEPPPLLPDDNKWGFFSALLDAKEGDNFRAGSLILMTLHPYVQYRAPERLWLKGCDQIMVGNRTLEDYFDYILRQPTYRDLPAEYWRDTSPSYYRLSGPNTVSRNYVDGSDVTDIPDFHSVDISLWTGPIGGGPLNMEFSGITDRFGNKYLLGGASFGLPGGGLRYSEGYVCTPYANCVSIRTDQPNLYNDSNIRGAIVGPCIGGSITVDFGGSLIRCESGSGAVIFSSGVSLSIGASGTAGLYIGTDPSMGWNWAIEDRWKGVSYVELMVQSTEQ